jgi:CRISPR/Cas system-associated endonuclease Cas3-HD
MLKAFTDARGMFINLDEVTRYLIYAVLKLAVAANRITKGKHNRKTLAFVKACVAYAHITIPSLLNSKDQIQLFMLNAEVALLNGLISETDSIIKAILLILNSKYKNNQDVEAEEKMTEEILNVVGFLVVVPSNPDNHFDLTYAIMNLMEKKEWNRRSVYRRVKIYIALFNYLCTQAQDQLPYNIPRVDSNDTIFLGDETFQTGLNECLTKIFDKISKFV